MPPVMPQDVAGGAKQWRGRLEDAELIEREFPALASALARPESRRQVMRMMAASVALGGLGGCSDPSSPDGHLVPAVNQAADIVPGLPNRFATAMTDGGAATGIVVTQQMGRPIKVEGNSAHPASLGATSIHGQAILLDFYDPDRSAGGDAGRPAVDLAGAAGRHARPAGAAGAEPGGGVAHPHRAAGVAHPGGGCGGAGEGVSKGALGAVGAGVARPSAARGAAGVWTGAGVAAAGGGRGCRAGAGQRSHQFGAGAFCGMRAISRRGAIRCAAGCHASMRQSRRRR